MKYLDITEVRALNIEHTSMCNLLCPQCARVVDGKTSPELFMREMTLEEYKRILPEKLCKQLGHIFFCGNYGDPCAAIEFFDCVKYLRSHDVKLTIYTNGSMRGTRWWRDLANILSDKCKVVFAIDGLKDTNHLYRVNSRFNRVIQNASAFIEEGGNARWDYLVFDYNYHQVGEAKKMAKDLGFKLFNEKLTKRFIDNKNYKTDKGGGEFGKIVEKYGSWAEYINQTEITCKYQRDKILYIDFDLNLWPCCWVGAPLFFHGHDNIQKDQIYKLIVKYGDRFNSLKDKSIEEVLNHPWFQEDLVKSWSKQLCSGKLMTCGRTCGTEYKFSSGDKSNKKETEL
jgi:MoaA/NifB/PqqE/SkfB family radical SAM enzyme